MGYFDLVPTSASLGQVRTECVLFTQVSLLGDFDMSSDDVYLSALRAMGGHNGASHGLISTHAIAPPNSMDGNDMPPDWPCSRGGSDDIAAPEKSTMRIGDGMKL